METFTFETLPEARPFVWPDRDMAWLDAGFVDASEQRLQDTAARAFQAANAKVDTQYRAEALAKAAKANGARLADLNAAYRAADALETVVSTERIAKAHWALRASGAVVALMGFGLLVPLPLVVGAGIEESYLIDRVTEQPLVGLLYGFAPMAAAIAAHGFRDTLKSDRWRRLFDRAVYASTLAAFAAWTWNFGPTFLVDVLADPSAAAEAGSLADFYGYHLALEVTGAASAYCAAMHLLTTGARRVSKISEARGVLGAAIEAETQISLEIARQRDITVAEPGTYAAAEAAYQDHAVLKAEVAAKLFAAKSASEAVQVLSELRGALITPQNGDTHA